MRSIRPKTQEVRCQQPHPNLVGRPCGALLTELDPQVQRVERGGSVYGAAVVPCSRCATRYRIVPVAERRMAA